MTRRIIKNTDGSTIAIVSTLNFYPPDSEEYYVNFISEDKESLQLATMHRKKGEKIYPHKHRLVKREIFGIGEVLIIISGKIIVDLYNSKNQFVESVTLVSKDVIVLLGGGHAIDIIEDTELYEIKQGPYLGGDDKEYF